MVNLSELKEVELRNIWSNEAKDFTPWLAKEENIKYISNIIGIEMVDVEVEQLVGSYRCDILCKDETSANRVIIENQLEESNHDHLGKLITYASGLDAKYIIWIVKEAREEHRSAIEWLNNNSLQDINYFLIEIHAYEIDDSKPAPYFKVIEAPNDFIKRGKLKIDDEELNKSQQERLLFWEQFNDYIKKKCITDFKQLKPSINHWQNIAIGTSKCCISITLVDKQSHIVIELYIWDDKELYDELEKNKEVIESNTGLIYDWMRLNDKKASRIKTSIEGLNFVDHSNYDELFSKIISIVNIMKKEFTKYL